MSQRCQNRKWSVIRALCVTALIREAKQLQRHDQRIEMFLMATGVMKSAVGLEAVFVAKAAQRAEDSKVQS
jgi:hypothetical protein